MKKLLFFLLLPFIAFSDIHHDFENGLGNADQITYEWLTGDAVASHDTDHVRLFKKIFQQTKVKNILEFGVGFPTKYFLDHCNKVISVDIITHGYGPGIMKKFINIYSDYSNWIPIAFFSGYLGADFYWAPYRHMGSEAIYKATSYQHAHQKNYAKLDDFYLLELNSFITNLLKYNKTDAAFVGHAIFLRGDFVQLLFNKVPIIVSHDTSPEFTEATNDIYGFSRVVTPSNYEEIYFPLKNGTTAWIQKKPETDNLIEALKNFSQELK